MEYKVEILWEYDKKQKDYKSLDLHGYYNTNFQKFSYRDGNLCFMDGSNEITILGEIE